jgi:hypothetical protein
MRLPGTEPQVRKGGVNIVSMHLVKSRYPMQSHRKKINLKVVPEKT